MKDERRVEAERGKVARVMPRFCHRWYRSLCDDVETRKLLSNSYATISNNLLVTVRLLATASHSVNARQSFRRLHSLFPFH
jgi:hypothetical protein